jgi:hypothetical protein
VQFGVCASWKGSDWITQRSREKLSSNAISEFISTTVWNDQPPAREQQLQIAALREIQTARWRI